MRVFNLDINMVFGIVKDEKKLEKSREIYDFYDKFSQFIGQANSVGELTANEKVMEDLIKNKYRNITSKFLNE